MRGKCWLLLLILGLDAFTLTAGAARENIFAFTLAVLRRDGTLVPFAVYDGKRFRNPWPEPEKTADAPIALSDIPKGWWYDHQPIKEWTFWPLDGGSSRTVHVTGVTWFPAHCLQGVGLRTDYKPTVLPPLPRVQPYPKDGLAVSGRIAISPITIVKDPTDKTALALGALLPAAINPKETEIIHEYLHGGWQHSYTQEEREKLPVALEALYRVPHGAEGKDVYYYEAVKRYFLPKLSASPEKEKEQAKEKENAKEKQTPECDLVTFVSGWFTTDERGKIGDLFPDVRVTSCDYAKVGFMLPLGTITLDRKTLWIGQWSNWQGEAYAIMEPKASAVEKVFEAPGGRCEKQ